MGLSPPLGDHCFGDSEGPPAAHLWPREPRVPSFALEALEGEERWVGVGTYTCHSGDTSVARGIVRAPGKPLLTGGPIIPGGPGGPGSP